MARCTRVRCLSWAKDRKIAPRKLKPNSNAARAGPIGRGTAKPGPTKTTGVKRPLNPPSPEQIVSNSPRQSQMALLGKLQSKEPGSKHSKVEGSKPSGNTEIASPDVNQADLLSHHGKSTSDIKNTESIPPKQANCYHQQANSASQSQAINPIITEWEKHSLLLYFRFSLYSDYAMDEDPLTDVEPDEEFRIGELLPQTLSTLSEDGIKHNHFPQEAKCAHENQLEGFHKRQTFINNQRTQTKRA